MVVATGVLDRIWKKEEKVTSRFSHSSQYPLNVNDKEERRYDDKKNATNDDDGIYPGPICGIGRDVSLAWDCLDYSRGSRGRSVFDALSPRTSVDARMYERGRGRTPDMLWDGCFVGWVDLRLGILQDSQKRQAWKKHKRELCLS